MRLEGLGKLKKLTSSGTRTGDLPACSIVPQPITLPRTPRSYLKVLEILGLQPGHNMEIFSMELSREQVKDPVAIEAQEQG
jgi:hypothetical protein